MRAANPWGGFHANGVAKRFVPRKRRPQQHAVNIHHVRLTNLQALDCIPLAIKRPGMFHGRLAPVPADTWTSTEYRKNVANGLVRSRSTAAFSSA